MKINRIGFDELEGADLYIDCIYEGGSENKHAGDEPLHILLPKCGTGGGFRKVNREDDSEKPAYVVLYTTMSELEWPDYLDEETGIFRYYGDNRKSGRELTDTHFKGNELLKQVFEILNSGNSLKDIPPFFIFKSTGESWNVKFLGLAAPGNPKLSPDKDLVSFWRTMEGNRFQNYEAYFTILDTGEKPITQEWLNKLIWDHNNNLKFAPSAWKKFIANGRAGIQPLKAPKIIKIPSKKEQLECDAEGEKCIQIIYEHYKDNPYGFEACATDLILKMDSNFLDFELTQPWRDGGRDAYGKYQINTGGKCNNNLIIDCSLEAKCFSKNHGVGVKPMSRLISRIKYRQFGILITTSYVSKQAYEEVVVDGHPILIVTASDIATILKNNSITTENINDWLNAIDEKDKRRFS